MNIRERIASWILGEDIGRIRNERDAAQASTLRVLHQSADYIETAIKRSIEAKHLRIALTSIRDQRTAKANATVKRMAATAESALEARSNG